MAFTGILPLPKTEFHSKTSRRTSGGRCWFCVQPCLLYLHSMWRTPWGPWTPVWESLALRLEDKVVSERFMLPNPEGSDLWTFLLLSDTVKVLLNKPPEAQCGCTVTFAFFINSAGQIEETGTKKLRSNREIISKGLRVGKRDTMDERGSYRVQEGRQKCQTRRERERKEGEMGKSMQTTKFG